MNKAWSAALVVLSFFLQASIRGIDVRDTAGVALPPEYMGATLDPRIMNRLLGLRIVAADLVWIDLLMKSDLIRGQGSFSPFYRAARTVTRLDPDHFYGYYVAGLYLSVVKDDILGASALLLDGAKHIQKNKFQITQSQAQRTAAWKVLFTLGYNLLFEEFELEEGARWIREAATIDGAPLYVLALAKKVETEAGQIEVGERILADVHSRIQHPEDRKRVERKMLGLAMRRELIDLNEKFSTFLKSTEAYSHAKERAFKLFLRSHSHSGKNLLGHKLRLNALGRIEAEVAQKTDQ